jgi:hypothetical protein
MIKRLLWFAMGAAVAIFVYVKVRRSLQGVKPSALGDRVATSAANVSERAQGFLGRVRAATAEREAELREALDLPE